VKVFLLNALKNNHSKNLIRFIFLQNRCRSPTLIPSPKVTARKRSKYGELHSVWEIVFHHNDISVFRTRTDFRSTRRWPIKLIDFEVSFFPYGCWCCSCVNFLLVILISAPLWQLTAFDWRRWQRPRKGSSGFKVTQGPLIRLVSILDCLFVALIFGI